MLVRGGEERGGKGKGHLCPHDEAPFCGKSGGGMYVIYAQTLCNCATM